MSDNERFPLGAPINRPPLGPELTPIADRPNWFTDKKGLPVYREPERKTT